MSASMPNFYLTPTATPPNVRMAAVHVNLAWCTDFREQLAAVATAMDRAPRGTTCVLVLGSRTAPPPEGWLVQCIMLDGYLWELVGDRSMCERWLGQYQRELEDARARRARRRAGTVTQ